MKNLSDKNKRRLIVAGLGVVCIALVIAISSQYKTTVPAKVAITPSSTASSDVTTDFNISSPIENQVVSVQPKGQSSKVTDPSSTAPTDQSVQNLQSKVSKPKQPTESAIKNPSKKPSSTQSASSTAAQGGEKKGGTVAIPGFDNVEVGGENTGTTASDMYENGKKIADMN